MLIKALCDYYDVLAEKGKVLPAGYSNVPIKYALALTADGKIDGIISLMKKEVIPQKNGKEKIKDIASVLQFPQRTEKSGIESNVVEHRPLYIFGLNYDNGKFTPDDRTEKARKSHRAFVERNLEFTEGLDSPLVKAFRSFLETWVPENETENAYLLELGKDYAGSGFAFCLSGRPNELLHDDSSIRRKWELEYAAKQGETGDYRAQCAVTGELSDIARLHSKIKGIAGGASTGGVLIGYNNPSDCSYGNEQSYNSSISETAMRKYTEALNYLLKDSVHRIIVDDITVVFWAMDGSESCENFMQLSLSNFAASDKAKELETKLKSLLKRVSAAKLTVNEINAFDEDLDGNTDFYIVGFKPNSSRISIKFIYRQKVADIIRNIAEFQQNLQVSEELKIVSLNDIKRECISPNSSSEKINPELLNQLFKSAAYGTDFPYVVLETVIRRVKTDKYINPIRVGIIKAYLIRKEKEEIKMALDKENCNQAYLCGRLFATLENIQKFASKGTLNRTIKDKYFSSAAAKPATTFPMLMQLSQHHMKNLTDRSKVYYSKLIGEITDNLENEFPNTLSLAEQGKFIIGYYQQLQVFFNKKTEDEN